jgi:hypothetical protein
LGIDFELEYSNGDHFQYYQRINNWSRPSISILKQNGERQNIDTYCADFKNFYFWKTSSNIDKYKIMYTSNNKISGINLCNIPEIYIAAKNNIYNFYYDHGYIRLYPCTFETEIQFTDKSDEYLDDFIRRYKKTPSEILCGDMLNFHLREYFDRDFFSRGPKWNLQWKKEHSPEDITKLNSVYVENGLFKIEIENITYPLYAYFLLDLENMKIIEAKKYEPENNLE